MDRREIDLSITFDGVPGRDETPPENKEHK
jgi:hypothetical protein